MVRIYFVLLGLINVEVSIQRDGGEYHFGNYNGQHEYSGYNEKETDVPIYYTNSCDHKGSQAIGCDEGYVIKIHDVKCLPLNNTCYERQLVAKLCDGLRSCSNVDIRKQLYYDCKSYPDKKVYTSFQCIPEQTKPFCRTNVCGKDSPDIRCRRGKVFHLLSAKCFHGQLDCKLEIYMAIYKMCENQRSCIMHRLRDFIPRRVCNMGYILDQNLFIDYICIDKNVVADRCNGSFVTQTKRFGVLVSPDYPHNPRGLEKGCYWAIYPENKHDVIDVTIHMSYSEEEQCDSRFLQLQYTVCTTNTQKMEPFCDKGRVNVKIHSCGTVFVIQNSYNAGEEKGNRFLVSYAVHKPDDTIPTYNNYSYQCEKPNNNSDKYPMPVSVTTTEETSLTTQRAVYPGDMPINDSSVSGPEVKPEDKKKRADSTSDPWKFVTMLRVVVVNIFLGLLIIALIMALAFVCYRVVRRMTKYRTYGRQQNRPASKSETATTLDDKQSTEMQLLPGDGDKSPQSCKSQNTAKTEAEIQEQELLETMTQCPVTSSYETTIFHFNGPGTVNEEETIFYENGSGVSSFLPQRPLRRENNKNNNTESAYSSLDAMEDIQGLTDYTDMNSDSSKATDKCQETQITRQNSNDTCSSTRDSVKQFKANNDDYSVVIRSPEYRIEAQAEPGERREAKSSVSSEEGSASYEGVTFKHKDNKENNSKTAKKGQLCTKPIAHIHPVPEDTHINHVSPTTMHVIPEHDCLLHKIPPPPPPAKMPPSHVMQGHWGSPSRNSKNVDWHTQHYV